MLTSDTLTYSIFLVESINLRIYRVFYLKKNQPYVLLVFLVHPVDFKIFLKCETCVTIQLMCLNYFRIIENKGVMLLSRTKKPPCMCYIFLESSKQEKKRKKLKYSGCPI